MKAMTDDTIPMFNPGQLEACDNVSDEDSRLFAIDRRTKKIVKEVSSVSYFCFLFYI